jgi:aryl-alcohol dehydrogenase-like predicted oxidoreductase
VQSSLKLALSHPATSAVVVGTINPDHLRDNVAAARLALG